MVDEFELQGLFNPYFVQVPDGYHTERIVRDEEPVAGPVRWDDPPTTVKWHLEPCRIPKFRTELRWEVVI